MNLTPDILRSRFLVAMGLGSLALSLPACFSEEEKEEEKEQNISPNDVDDDGDGLTENEGDCDDGDAGAYPDAEEEANDGIDQDCDGEDLVDVDLDGFAAADDCDDENADVNPEAEEYCDGLDNDCNDLVDDDALDRTIWYADADQDTYGEPESFVEDCDQPDGYVGNDSDCDDTNVTINPSAEELCDGLDNDCSGGIDDDATDAIVWYADTDSDGYGDPDSQTMACTMPEGHADNADDCDDGDPGVSPLGTEFPNDGIDNNCNGTVDEVSCSAVLEPSSGTDLMNALSSTGSGPYLFCEPLPSDGTACVDGSMVNVWSLINNAVGAHPLGFCEWFGYDVCGPDPTYANECCYAMSVDESCMAVGRPLTVDGEARMAEAVHRADWDRQRTSDFSGLSQLQKETVRDRWLQAAREEHASVASFARFSMELMSLGAPPELLAGSARAQVDEITHARECFAFAGAVFGETYGPGPLDLTGAMDESMLPADIMERIIREACVNESLAAAEASWLAERTLCGAVEDALSLIAEDESRHASLGWRSLRWLLTAHPELVPRAAAIFRQAEEAARVSTLGGGEDAWLAEHGHMPHNDREGMRAAVWRSVIRPCADALLSAQGAGTGVEAALG
jgi:hypothetical protein